MNTILEKFMFHTSSKSSEDKGAGKAAGDEAIDLSPAAEGPPRSRRVFENPKRGRQAIGVAKQLIEAGEAMRDLRDLHARGEADADALDKKLDSLRQQVEAIVAKKEEFRATDVWKFGIDVWNLAVCLKQTDRPKSADDVGHLSCKIAVEALPLVCGKRTPLGEKIEIHLSVFRRLLEVGKSWMVAEERDKADYCFSCATDLAGTMGAFLEDDAVPKLKREEVLVLLFTLQSGRGRLALAQEKEIILSSIVGRVKEMPKTLPSNLDPVTLCALAEELNFLGEDLLAHDRTNESVSVFDSAIEVLGDLGKLAKDSTRTEISQSLKNLLVRITKNLAHAHLEAKNFSAAQAVLTFLRPKLGQELVKHASFPLMSIRAALGLEKFSEALEILMATTLGAENPSHAVHLEKFKVLYEGCRTKDIRDQIVALLVKFCAQAKIPTLAVGFCAFLLSPSASQEVKTRKHEDVVAVVGNPQITALFEQERGECDRLYKLVWNEAVDAFKAEDLKSSRDLFQICLLYASLNEPGEGGAGGASGGENRRTSVLRCLSQVLLQQKEPKKAMQHIALAKDLEPHNILNDRVMILLAIAQGDYAGSLTQIRSLAEHPSFHPAHLLQICKEAVGSGQKRVARECLHKLFEHQRRTKEVTVAQSTVLRCLVTLCEEDGEADGEAAGHLEEARALCSEDGAAFLGGDGDGGPASALWFASRAWNLGLKSCESVQPEDGEASQHGGLLQASRMFEVSGTFLETLGGDHAPRACESLLYASVLLADHLDRGGPDGAQGDGGEGKDAAEEPELRARLGRLVRALDLSFLRHKRSLGEVLARKIGGHLPWLQYELACQRGDAAEALRLLLELRTLSEDPGRFIRMASRADLLRGPEAAAVKASALGIALKCFQGAPGPPDNEGVAFCLRNLVELRQTDREGLGVCSQALEVLRGLPAGEYPEEEVEWLATTAWNRGVQLHRFGEGESARQWMSLGLELFPHCGEGWRGRNEVGKYNKYYEEAQQGGRPVAAAVEGC